MDMIVLEDNKRSARMMQKRKSRRRKQRIRRMVSLMACLAILLAASAGLTSWLDERIGILGQPWEEFLAEQRAGITETDGQVSNGYPQELLDMLEKNDEVYDYVKGYPDRADYIGKDISLAGDYKAEEVPLLMQWDKRWGYDSLGDTMIGIGGCGPTCLAMAYIYLTGDVQMNPRKMADYAYDNGYYTADGTSWSLWTSGMPGLGLTGTELSLSEAIMKKHLDEGEVIVCSMAPGDFTTTGHFILIRGYDENGFYVNDPNRKSNSQKQWDYDRLSRQIKCLWAIGKE